MPAETMPYVHQVRLTPTQHDYLKSQAEVRGITMSAVMRDCIDDAINPRPDPDALQPSDLIGI